MLLGAAQVPGWEMTTSDLRSCQEPVGKGSLKGPLEQAQKMLSGAEVHQQMKAQVFIHMEAGI